MAVLVVTGTGTGVGKTVATAAVAALARTAGRRLALVKAAQTGLAPQQPGDVHLAGLLAGVPEVHEFARFPDPLSPAAAARRCGTPGIPVAQLADRIRELAATRDVLVEGAGGLLVDLDGAGGTVADLAGLLGASVLLVVGAGLGTLNATALTVEALDRRGLRRAGVVIGSWPRRPGLAARSNVVDLPVIIGTRLAGALPAGAPAAEDFTALAAAALGPELGGHFDAADFTRRHAPAGRHTPAARPRAAGRGTAAGQAPPADRHAAVAASIRKESP